MSKEESIGKLKEKQCSLTVEWEIANFSSLSEKVDEGYSSSLFYFSDALWYLKIFPNGQSKSKSEGYTGLFLYRHDSGPTVKSIWFKISIKNADMQIYESENVFERSKSWGWANFMKKSTLLETLQNNPLSSGLTVICCLRHSDPHSVGDSLVTRLTRLSSNLSTILYDGEGSDFTVKVKGNEFSVHKIILKYRSEYFAKMLQHDMEEVRTGVVNMEDMHPDAIEAMLTYIYSARMDEITNENVLHIYKAAHTYDMQELKELCKEFIKDNLCDERVCEVIKFVDMYDDKELKDVAREYFYKNVKKIVKTDIWQIFYEENQKFAMDLISDTIDKCL